MATGVYERTTGRVISTQARASFLFSLSVVLWVPMGSLRADSEADLFPDPGLHNPTKVHLDVDHERRAEAFARFATGILLEESDGPERAFESFNKVLALDPQNLHLSLRVAREYLRRGDVAGAVGIIKDSAKARPKDAVPHLILGEIYLRQLQKPTVAEQHAKLAINLQPELFAARELLWQIAMFSGQTGKAVGILDSAARNTTTDPSYWLQLAELHRKLPQQGAAASEISRKRRLAALEKAAASAPENDAVLVRAADLHVLHGEIAAAAPLYQKAFDLAPTTNNLREKLAACYVDLQNYELAVPLLEAILADNPQNLPVCDELARIARELGKIEDVLRYQQKAVVLAPHEPERYRDLAQLLVEQNQPSLAILYLEQALERFPRTGVFSYMLGATLTRAGRPVDAMGAFQRAVKEAPHAPDNYLTADFYFEYGMAAEQSGNYQLAADFFRKSIELAPERAARAANYLGYMWVERNENLEEAERYIRMALEREPDNGAYLDSLGWLHYRRGEFAEALIVLLRASELLPTPDSVVLEHLGDVYLALGRKPEALLYWKKSHQLDPQNEKLLSKIDSVSEPVAKTSKTP